MRAPESHISVFTRMPVPGVSKTRLIAALGAEGAADVQRAMSEHVVRQARIAAAVAGGSLEARVTGGHLRDARRWLGIPCVEQGDAELGTRLAHALSDGCRRAPVAAVIGGDCPTVDAADMRAVLAAAASAGAALIPASDGGFCMLALARHAADAAGALLEGIGWGSSAVCAQVLERLRAAGLEPQVLPMRDDVDEPADLAAWEAVRRAWYDPPESLTIVIPTLDEAARLRDLLPLLAEEPVDVVVADGGSQDATAEVAEAAGVRVVHAGRGRGAQMNAGAAGLTSDAVLFLHADCMPAPGLAAAVRSVLADPEVLLGAFRFSLGATSTALRLVEWGTNARVRRGGLPFGDQGFFMRGVVFRALGGFREIPIMEDFELARTARLAGRVALAPEALITSDRRWREAGVWRTTAVNQLTALRYRLGASPEELAQWRARQTAKRRPPSGR